MLDIAPNLYVMKSNLVLVLITVAFLGCSKQQPPASAYAGQDSRAVKSLSDEEIRDLLEGAGMGYAKVAELNGFPGPKHVLELADELVLTPQQKAETAALFDRMNARARELGAQLVDTEKSLDAIFAGGDVDSAAARRTMSLAADIEAQIRWTHVSAHLSQTEILTHQQRQSYVELRGYRSEHQHRGDHQHGT